MTQHQPPHDPPHIPGPERPKERPLTGLSARALVLTVRFVLLAEAVLFMPSMARWLEQELNDRLSDGHLAIRHAGSGPPMPCPPAP